VINTNGWFPVGIVMTALTLVTSIYMGNIFSGGCCSIVAADAVVHNVEVIKIGRNPGIGRMA
jgi:hypothetical protein